MASEKMKEPEQFVKRHCIIRISSIVDSLLFPHRQEKGEASFVVRKKIHLFWETVSTQLQI
jgi:hypothetical protein